DEAAVVFVDGPPLLQVSGSLLLTGLAGGVVVVARAGRTRRPDLASALDLVAHARTLVLGVVLNDARGAKFSEHIVPSGDRGPERPEHAAEPAVPPQEEVELPDATARGVEPRYPPASDEAFPDLSRAHR
ncbi:MAG: hypothetical protein H0V67_05445, partial [Geodermatophilaceae bacterium]|nr:hypothetical protein [Geodermatophilaceae bacterium]